MPTDRLDATTLAQVKAALEQMHHEPFYARVDGALVLNPTDVTAVTVVINAAPALVAGCETLLRMREHVTAAIRAEEELDGPMPTEARLALLADPESVLRANVRATKKSIEQRALAALNAAREEPPRA